MAESDPSPKCTRVTMTIPEVKRLAGRLLARGRTMPADDASDGQGDLRLAAKALLAMTRSARLDIGIRQAHLWLMRDACPVQR
jgi:hypothetical protein